jgi:hypothetical protein
MSLIAGGSKSHMHDIVTLGQRAAWLAAETGSIDNSALMIRVAYLPDVGWRCTATPFESGWPSLELLLAVCTSSQNE